MNEDQLPHADQAMLPQNAPSAASTGAGESPGTVEPHSAAQAPHETPAACGSVFPDWRLRERDRRAAFLQAFRELVLDGETRAAAARRLHVSFSTLRRWQMRFDEHGLTGLIPHTDNCGRSSSWESVLEDEGFTAKLLEIYLATIGAGAAGQVARAARTGRRTAKMAAALVAMAEEGECPAALATLLRRGKFPLCLLRYLKRVTPEMESRLRGAKHFQLTGVTSRRDLTLRFEDGSRAEMPAGFKWVFDDMSVNQPFWAEVDGRILFSRQGLYAIDQRSLKWLGHTLVARPREAYRAEDILRFLRDLFLAYQGKPDVIVFEQGVWRARKIHGFKLDEFGGAVATDFERPAMDDGERHMLTDGLSAIGIRVVFATSAHGKIIEPCFNGLQTQIAIHTRDFVNIGRHAGEFEIPARRLAQVRSGSRSPGFLGFARMQELSQRIDAAIQGINSRANSRGEIPDELWAADIAKRPLAANAEADAAVFLPELRERVIDGGRVTVKVNGQEHDFRAPWMIQVGGGFKVFCRFDPAEPSRGAAIYNRERGAANFEGWQFGQFIGFAAWEMPAPSLDVVGPVRGVTPEPVEEFYGPRAVDQGDVERRKQEKIVATTFSAYPRPGQPAVKTAEARDGEGRVARVQTAGTPAADAPQLRPIARRRTAFDAPTAEQVNQRRARLEARAALAHQLRALSTDTPDT